MSKTATVERVEARDLREGDRLLEPVAGRIHDVWQAAITTFTLRGERVTLLLGCPVVRHVRPRPPTVEWVEARDLREGDRLLEPVAGRVQEVWVAGTVSFRLRGEREQLLLGCPVLRHKRPQP